MLMKTENESDSMKVLRCVVAWKNIGGMQNKQAWHGGIVTAVINDVN